MPRPTAYSVERSSTYQRKGDYPYAGEWVLDFVDGYVVDDDIILMAEDGGYFDEYEIRPIAYRWLAMLGKQPCSYSQAKDGCDQGFSSIRWFTENILPFWRVARGQNSTSRNEQDRSATAQRTSEQAAIAGVLMDIDAELQR